MNRLILCALLLAAGAVMGRSIPESGYSNDNGVIRVSVFIDLAKEKSIKHPEGTAMLRANRLLHKACPKLPGKYSVTGRVLTNSHNRVEKTYSYVVEYDSPSIDAVVAQAEIDAEKAREAESRALEKAAAEKAAAEKLAVEKICQETNAVEKLDVERAQTNMVHAALTKESDVISNSTHAVKCDAAKTNDVAVVQDCATNTSTQRVEFCSCETKTSATNAPISVCVHEDKESVANEPAVKVKERSEKSSLPSIQLKDLTVKDIKEKMVKPKVTEKNGFKQVDVDSFGGIDPMEE